MEGAREKGGGVREAGDRRREGEKGKKKKAKTTGNIDMKTEKQNFFKTGIPFHLQRIIGFQCKPVKDLI